MAELTVEQKRRRTLSNSGGQADDADEQTLTPDQMERYGFSTGGGKADDAYEQTLTPEQMERYGFSSNEGQADGAAGSGMTLEEARQFTDDPDLIRLYMSGQVDPNAETPPLPDNARAVAGRISYDVTDETDAVAEQDASDYGAIYGDKPRPGLRTRIGAFIGEVSDLFSGEENPQPNKSQENLAAERGRREEFFAEANKIYESYDTASDYGLDTPGFFGGEDVRVDARVVPDEEGNLTTEYVRIPKPGSTYFDRMLNQTGSNIVQQWGGLLTEGKFLEESDLEKSVPDYEQRGMEGLGTLVFTFGLSGAGMAGAGRRVGQASGALGVTRRGSKAYNWSKITGASLGAALSDTVMSTEGDIGAFFRPRMAQEVFKIEDPEKAASVAMFTDGLLVNGALDTLLYVAGKGAGFVGKKVKDTAGLFSPKLVRGEAERQTLLSAVNIIDPELSDLPPNQLASSLKNLATVLDHNASTLIEIGETSAEVSLDTVNTLSRGAEEYIRASRAGKRRGMTDQEWNDYVRTEARDMVERTVSLVRSQEGNSYLRQRQAEMSESARRAMRDEADRLTSSASAADDPLGEATETLVEQQNADIRSATEARDSAAAEADRLRTASGRAVEQDPYIRQLLDSNDPLRFFNDDSQVEELRRILGEDLYQEYDAAWKEVDAAYGRIPNADIDTEKFVSDVNAVVEEANILDSSGARSRQILGRIYRAVQPEESLNDAGELVIEDPEELIARLDGQIGFQDLYKVRKSLSQMIGRTSDEGVKGRLRDLKDSITDGDNGQLAYVRSTGDESAAAAAEEADRLYIDTMSRFQNSEPLKRFSRRAEERRRGDRTATSEGFPPRGQPELDSGSMQDTLPSALADPTGSQFDVLARAFSSTGNADRLNEAAADLYIARGTQNLAAALRGNTNQSPEIILRAFEEQARFLRQAGNPVYQKLEDAAARIRQTQQELGDELLAADELQQAAAEQLRQAENSIVSRFVRNRKPGMATGDAQQEITSILGAKDAGDEIEALMDEVARLPDGSRQATRQALQGAVLRGLRSKIFGSEAIGMSSATETAANLRMGNLDAITDETRSSLLSGVRAAFPDKPSTVAGIEAALNSLNTQGSVTRLRINQTGSPTAANINVKDSVSTAILFSLGYMNAKAAAARRLTSEQVKRIEAAAEQSSKETLAMILAAPEEFGTLLNRVAKKEDPSALGDARRAFLASARAGVRYASRTEFLPPQADLIFGLVEDASERGNEQEEMEAFEQ